MRLLSFGTITLPELNGRDNGLGSQARSNIINLQNGGYDLDGNNVYLQPMNISRSAVVTEDIDNTINNLFGEMNKGRMLLKAQMRSGSERHTFAKMVMQMRDVSADKYTCEQSINLQWNTTYPYWISSSLDFSYFDHGLTFDSFGNFDASFSITNTLSQVDTSDIVVYDNSASNVDVYRVFICFEATPTTNTGTIEVKNNTNGSGFRWNSTLNSTSVNKRLDIDCLSKTAFSSDNTNEYANIETISSNGLDWFYLSRGSNSIEVSALDITTSGGLLNYYIISAPHFL